MTQKGELALTAPPGGQRGGGALGDSFTVHLLSGPLQEPPRMAPETERRAPKPGRATLRGGPGRLLAPPAGRPAAIRCQRRAGHRAAPSPTLFTSRRRNRSESASARPGTKDAPPAERPPPGRVEIAWFGRRWPPAPATALKFNSASRTCLYGRARGRSAGEIDAPAATPRRPAGCPAPCNYLTALTEPRNLRESPASSLLSGGRKGNKEAF